MNPCRIAAGDWQDGRGFEVSGISNPELETSDRVCRALETLEDFLASCQGKPVVQDDMAGRVYTCNPQLL
ncbi:MAG: hypothetical protein EWM73_02190 [Nitrospira sp.]|nr:MAG: hypothetical protein EWM73_02190 [Nitrospira sp.]